MSNLKRGDTVEYETRPLGRALFTEWRTGTLMLESMDSNGLYLIQSEAGEYVTVVNIRKGRKKLNLEVWVNIYPTYIGGIHDSKLAADHLSLPKRIACKKIVIDGYEGDMDE